MNEGRDERSSWKLLEKTLQAGIQEQRRRQALGHLLQNC